MERERVISFTRGWRLFSSDGRWVTQIWQPGRWYGPPATMDRMEGEFVNYLTPRWRLLSRAGRWYSQLERYGQRWESQHSQDAGGSPPAGEQAGTNREALVRGTALAPLQAEPSRLDVAGRTAGPIGERLEAARAAMRSRVEDDSDDRVQGDRGRELENGIVSHCLVCSDTPSMSPEHGLCPTCDRIFRDLGKWAASLVREHGCFPPSCQRSARSCASDASDASVILLCPVCSTDLPAEAADAWTSSSPYINSFCPICKESLLHTVRWARFGYDCWL
jgi:hypothetical protein